MLNAEAGVTDFRGMPELASNLVFGFNNAVDGAATFDRLLTPLSSLLNWTEAIKFAKSKISIQISPTLKQDKFTL